MTSADVLRRARRLQVLASRPGSQVEVVIEGGIVRLRDSRRLALGCSITLAVFALLVPAFVVFQAHGLRAAAEMHGAYGLAAFLVLWSALITCAIVLMQARRPYLEADAGNQTVVINDLRPTVERLPMDGVRFLLLFATLSSDGGWDGLYAVRDHGCMLFLTDRLPMPTIRIVGYLFGKEVLRVVSRESRALSIENLDSLQSYLKRGFTTDDRHWMARAISTGAVLDLERLRSAGETIYDPTTQEDSFRLDK